MARNHDLPNDPSAPGLARAAVASACEDWELHDGLYEVAATVATELVSNAVEHAATACVLHLALDQNRLQIAVRDNSPASDARPQITAGERGYGLLIVQGLSRGWDVTPHPNGKTVWALLDPSAARSTDPAPGAARAGSPPFGEPVPDPARAGPHAPAMRRPTRLRRPCSRMRVPGSPGRQP